MTTPLTPHPPASTFPPLPYDSLSLCSTAASIQPATLIDRLPRLRPYTSKKSGIFISTQLAELSLGKLLASKENI